MDFPPVSLGEEDPLYSSQGDVGPSAITGSVTGISPEMAATDLTALNSNTALSEACRRCLQGYYHMMNWDVPFPQHHAAPLLYLPEECRKLRYDSDSFGVMGSEWDVLSRGMLERIPLGYFPLQLEDVREGLDAADKTRANIDDMQNRVIASGQIKRVMWKAAEVNKALEPEDINLLDTDIDQRLEHRRDLPSITLLLQRPTYTEMSSDSSPEQRHATRLRRAVPEPVRRVLAASQSAGEMSAAIAGLSSPTSPAMQFPGGRVGGGGGVELPMREGSPGLPQDQEDSAVARLARAAEEAGLGPEAGDMLSSAQLLHLAKRKTWPDDVKRSFRFARTLDEHFLGFLKDLTSHKLGLNPDYGDHLYITIEIWNALWTRVPTAKQQYRLWSLLCAYSYDYTGEAQSDLAESARQLKLPSFESVWQPLLERYTAALYSYIHDNAVEDTNKTPKERLDARKANLEIGAEERVYSSTVTHLQLPEMQMGKYLQRHSAKEFTRNQPISIYPISVTPIYPSGFEEAARMTEERDERRRTNGGTNNNNSPMNSQLDELELDFLAESADTMEHMVLPGAVIPEKKCSKRGPHVLVNGTNLLCADAVSVEDLKPLVNKEATEVPAGGETAPTTAHTSVPIGGTMVYHTLEENTFETLYTDEDNTSSYVFHQFNSPIFAFTAASREDARMSAFTMPENLRDKHDNQTVISHTHPILKNWSAMLPLPLEPTSSARRAGMLGRPRPMPLQSPFLENRNSSSQTSQPSQLSLLGGSQPPSSAASQTTDRQTSVHPVWSAVREAAKRGAVGLDGSVLTYNRIGLRGQFQKASKGQRLPVDRYAMVFASADEVLGNNAASRHVALAQPHEAQQVQRIEESEKQPHSPGAVLKREREEDEDAEADENGRKVKVKLEGAVAE